MLTIRSFALGIVLLALVGWCMIQQSVRQTQARYRLAELDRRQTEVRKRLAQLDADEQALRSPARLAMLVRQKKMELVVLNTAIPNSSSASARKPGQIDDADFPMPEWMGDTELAAVDSW